MSCPMHTLSHLMHTFALEPNVPKTQEIAVFCAGPPFVASASKKGMVFAYLSLSPIGAGPLLASLEALGWLFSLSACAGWRRVVTSDAHSCTSRGPRFSPLLASAGGAGPAFLAFGPGGVA